MTSLVKKMHTKLV